MGSGSHLDRLDYVSRKHTPTHSPVLLSLHSLTAPLQDLVHRDCHFIDNSNQACYAGYKAIKHRMQVRQADAAVGFDARVSAEHSLRLP